MAFNFDASSLSLPAAAILAESALRGASPVHSVVNQAVDVASRVPLEVPPEDSGPEDSVPEDSGALLSGADDSVAELAASEDSGAELSGADDSGAEDSAADDSGAEDMGSEDMADEIGAAAELAAAEEVDDELDAAVVDLEPQAALTSRTTAAPAAINAFLLYTARHALCRGRGPR